SSSSARTEAKGRPGSVPFHEGLTRAGRLLSRARVRASGQSAGSEASASCRLPPRSSGPPRARRPPPPHDADGRGPERVGHRADGARAERDRERRAHQPRHLPAHEELHHLRRVHHHPHRAGLPARRAGLEVRLRALHGAHHCHPQRRHHHDHLQGPREAVADARLVEAQGDLRHGHRARDLHGARHGALLLPGARHRLLHQRLRRAVHQGERQGADGGAVPASEHHQPGAHLRDPVPELVLRGAARRAAGDRLPGGAAGGDVHRRVRQLGVLQDAGHRLGLGRRHLGVQRRHLLPAGRAQVRHPLRALRQGLEQHQQQDGLHQPHRLRQGRARGAVGHGTEDAARPQPGHRHLRPLRRQPGLPRAVGARRAGGQARRGGQAQGAAHAQGTRRVRRQAQGPRH
ncbi:ATPase 8 plasma membrane-type, partial [Zea mays]